MGRATFRGRFPPEDSHLVELVIAGDCAEVGEKDLVERVAERSGNWYSTGSPRPS